MKLMKRMAAMALSLIMMLSMLLPGGITVAAMEGAGPQQSANVAYGCDLSFWNVGGSELDYSLVDFAKMKADGCEFAILRIGYEGSASRTNQLDTAFLEFYNRARLAGMPLGIYFYSLATTYNGAVEDAQWVINVIEQYDMYFEYPIYYDVEDSAQTDLGNSAMNSLCLGWCETLEAAGYFPGIYGGRYQVLEKLTTDFKSKYDTWLPAVLTDYDGGAQYDPTTRNYSDRCNMWQYAWYEYEYNGIGLNMLDVNVAYKDYPAIMQTYGYNNVGTSLQPGTYEYESDAAATVYASASTSATAVDTLSLWEKVLVTEVNDDGWGKFTTPRGVTGWAPLDSNFLYIGLDALSYTNKPNTDGITATVTTDGSVVLENTSADVGQYDFYLPFEVNTSKTPYLAVQIVPDSGDGYYFGITKSGSGAWMMRDCMSGDELVAEDSASYMTNTETLEIDVDYWWNNSMSYNIDTVRVYVAPNSTITVKYLYFSALQGVVNDTRFNMTLGNGTGYVAQNANLMLPDTLDIVDRNKTGSYEYTNGMLKVTSGSADGYAVSFNVDYQFSPETLHRFLVDFDAQVSFDIELLCETSDGERTFALCEDFWPEFVEVKPENGHLPAHTRTAGLDLLSCFTWNQVLPADGMSTVKKVTVSLVGEGVVYINAIQIAENDQLVSYTDDVVKSDSSTASSTPDVDVTPQPTPTLSSTVYTVENNVVSTVAVGTTIASFLGNVESDYTVTVYENGMQLSQRTIAKTGQIVKVSGSTQTVIYTISVTGDVNGDGKMNTTDLRDVMVSLLNEPLTGAQKTAADMNGVNDVDSTDAKALLSAILGN